MKIVRTFEVKRLCEEGEIVNKDSVYVVFEGYLGVYKKAQRTFRQGKGDQNVLLQDANSGNVIGADIHLFDDCSNLFSVETCEKTKLLEIDKAGFDKHMRTFMHARLEK